MVYIYVTVFTVIFPCLNVLFVRRRRRRGGTERRQRRQRDCWEDGECSCAARLRVEEKRWVSERTELKSEVMDVKFVFEIENFVN